MFCIYKTDPDWISVCKTLPPDTQVNFWRKNTDNLNLPTGSWFYFNERRTRRIVGRGILTGYSVKTIDAAWNLYGVGNGVHSLEQLRKRALQILEVDSPMAQIGCIMLSELEFLQVGREYVVGENDYHPNIVGPKFFQDGSLLELENYFRLSNEENFDALKDAPKTKIFEGEASFSYRRGYERNPEARKQCIAHHGHRCKACEVLMEDRYGPAACELIHVHHLSPISEFGGTHLIDPVKELAPLCPNCHAVAHRRVPPFSIEELKALLNSKKP